MIDPRTSKKARSSISSTSSTTSTSQFGQKQRPRSKQQVKTPNIAQQQQDQEKNQQQDQEKKQAEYRSWIGMMYLFLAYSALQWGDIDSALTIVQTKCNSDKVVFFMIPFLYQRLSVMALIYMKSGQLDKAYETIAKGMGSMFESYSTGIKQNLKSILTQHGADPFVLHSQILCAKFDQSGDEKFLHMAFKESSELSELLVKDHFYQLDICKAKVCMKLYGATGEMKYRDVALGSFINGFSTLSRDYFRFKHSHTNTMDFLLFFIFPSLFGKGGRESMVPSFFKQVATEGYGQLLA
eukprot:gnl/Carplike_NY0171/13352_a19472_118.p1 GENE.gnl/Carplike_NY0171/13352_a19472_118~~gnl/Carplike_NY0171/13352_a19472_118.p1  ORF type:complete len:314 (-),score=77.24 gnl/Carplike_NY0171/13352_a19472_118:15-902(-)